ncbi:hypothetical protein F9L16_23985 [Agarivorans sp. B2Z047]|uniref:Mor transcription activator family protein n=1 Tax=Agarivorans sp. B2Z047 TaxID=2652721 RepID=UPI00128CB95E|nr:Mor transcription activator family protein [Agarivorans sp. B2Z047]MPW32008.1 hypothetical protein [Agarivorans sp. B2Z047]UQN40658.1 hypothetical protein LQZ07_12755 [Agarivorans sp. B2Z047]UQN41872.1 hypothetical protein LQZ07_19150 [Agarivorans sp. B2Z047]
MKNKQALIVADLTSFLENSDSCRWSGLTGEVFEALKQELVDVDESGEVAARLVMMLSKNFGGAQLYFPRATALKIHIRNNAIWRDFNGKNITQLVREYGLSQPAVYRIIQQKRKEHQTTQEEG